MNAFVGVGLRPTHYAYLESNLDNQQLSPPMQVDWFEVITENFIDTAGRPLEILQKVRRDFPISLHGVSLSLGQADLLPGDLSLKNYLVKLKDLIARIDPILVSDHLCWTGLKTANLHNLLPLPYDDHSLQFLLPKIDYIQSFLGRRLILENLSAYFNFKNDLSSSSFLSSYHEWDFLAQLSCRSGCQILLDLNNIYVNAMNQQFDPYVYINAFEPHQIAEIHLAGFSQRGPFLFDTHAEAVHPPVWELFHYACQKFPQAPVLIEWDEQLPAFDILQLEACKAKDIWRKYHE